MLAQTTSINFNTHTTMRNSENNFKFLDPTNFNSSVMPYMLRGEVAEVQLTYYPTDKVEIKKEKYYGFVVYINGEAQRTAKKWKTIENFLNEYEKEDKINFYDTEEYRQIVKRNKIKKVTDEVVETLIDNMYELTNDHMQETGWNYDQQDYVKDHDTICESIIKELYNRISTKVELNK